MWMFVNVFSRPLWEHGLNKLPWPEDIFREVKKKGNSTWPSTDNFGDRARDEMVDRCEVWRYGRILFHYIVNGEKNGT